MATRFNTPGSAPSGGAGTAKTSDIDPPPSVPLQIFLFCAFLVTVAAYIVSQRAEPVGRQDKAEVENERLHRVFLQKTKYLNFTKIAFMAEYQKQYDLAVSNFQNALIMQNSAEAQYNLGNALLLQSKTNEAFTHFKAALLLDPRLRDIYTAWGQALIEQGKPEEAEEVYRKAIFQNPQFSLTHYKLAQALAARKKNTEALDEFAEAARLGLDDADFWCQYGSVLSQQGLFPQAEANLSKAASMNPDLPGVQFQLGFAQQQQGKYTEAIGHYETMLVQKPDDPDTLNNLALVYATATNPTVRNPKMAVSLASRASTAANDKNPRFLDTLARCYAADDDFLQATVWENKAVAQAGESGDKLLVAELTARYSRFQQHKKE